MTNKWSILDILPDIDDLLKEDLYLYNDKGYGVFTRALLMRGIVWTKDVWG